MLDQVVMSPNNGQLGIAIPLFRVHHEDKLEKMEGYVISLTKEKPSAYIIDVGEAAQVLNAEWTEKNLIFLGDL